MIVKFPNIDSFIKPTYYKIHLLYLKNLFEYNNIKTDTYKAKRQEHEVVFKIFIDDKEVYVDFGDHQPIHTINRPLIKCHLNKNYTGEIIPYSPISFYDWNEYFSLQNDIKYNFNTKILNNQSPGGNATKRRIDLKHFLLANYPYDIDLELSNQITYWNKINKAKIAIFAPGARINILDRGHLQYLAFGCCTISPEINDLLPYNKYLIPDVHYIKCNDDFSNLKEIIYNLKKDKCLEIGNNAKKLFIETCLPDKNIKYILDNI